MMTDDDDPERTSSRRREQSFRELQSWAGKRVHSVHMQEIWSEKQLNKKRINWKMKSELRWVFFLFLRLSLKADRLEDLIYFLVVVPLSRIEVTSKKQASFFSRSLNKTASLRIEILFVAKVMMIMMRMRTGSDDKERWVIDQEWSHIGFGPHQ